MKRCMINGIKFLFVLSLIFPMTAQAITLKQYEDQVAKYTAELNEKKNQIAKNTEEVSKIKDRIESIKQQIKESGAEIERLENEINKSNEDIEKKQKEIKKVVNSYQKSNSGNFYLEYILGADNITDMIYRFSVSEQLTAYNEKTIKELDSLIKSNENKKVELNKKQSELGNLNSQLYEEQSKIESDTVKIEGTLPSTEGQIDFYKKRVSYYKAKGCKSNDVIGVNCDVPVRVKPSGSSVAAGELFGKNGFRFPVIGGKITQNYGNNGHKGADIGKGCGTPIYAVAPGNVYYVGSTLDTYGAKMVLIVHNYNGRLVFSQYAHLSGYNVSVGQSVTTSTIIGYMGNTGYSFGCHLHLEMSEDIGWGYNDSAAPYKSYVRRIINPFAYVPRP